MSLHKHFCIVIVVFVVVVITIGDNAVVVHACSSNIISNITIITTNDV